jgi:hypothetical protein
LYNLGSAKVIGYVHTLCMPLPALNTQLNSMKELNMAYSQTSLVKDVMADARARAVIEKYIPGATAHPQVYDALYMTLGDVASFPQAGVSRQTFQAILSELAALD